MKRMPLELRSGSLHLTPHAFILPTLGTQLLVILVSISYLSSVIILSLSLPVLVNLSLLLDNNSCIHIIISERSEETSWENGWTTCRRFLSSVLCSPLSSSPYHPRRRREWPEGTLRDEATKEPRKDGWRWPTGVTEDRRDKGAVRTWP